MEILEQVKILDRVSGLHRSVFDFSQTFASPRFSASYKFTENMFYFLSIISRVSRACKLVLCFFNFVLRIAPNLRSLVYATGIKKGKQEDWFFMFDKYMGEPVASEKKKLMYALTSSEDVNILRRFVTQLIPGQTSLFSSNSIYHPL